MPRVLLTFDNSTKKATIYIESVNHNSSFTTSTILTKYYVTKVRTMLAEDLLSTIEGIIKSLADKPSRSKDITDAGIIHKIYSIDSVDAKILKDLLANANGKDISSDYYVGTSAVTGEVKELDWAVAWLTQIDINVDRNDFQPPTSGCIIC